MSPLNSKDYFFNTLEEYQKKAVTKAFDLLTSKKRKVLFQLDPGKTIILVALIKQLIDNNIFNKILILSATTLPQKHILNKLREATQFTISEELNIDECQITLLTYSINRSQININDIRKFDLIICNQSQYTNNEKIIDLFQNTNSKFLGLITSSTEKKGWFGNENISFTYSDWDKKRDIKNENVRAQVSEKALFIFCNKLFQQLN